MSERLTPHITGNQGEAPMDVPPTLEARIRELSDQLDDCCIWDAPHMNCYADPEEINRIQVCLYEVADELFDYQKLHGVAI